jgi:hypothetical protein
VSVLSQLALQSLSVVEGDLRKTAGELGIGKQDIAAMKSSLNAAADAAASAAAASLTDGDLGGATASTQQRMQEVADTMDAVSAPVAPGSRRVEYLVTNKHIAAVRALLTEQFKDPAAAQSGLSRVVADNSESAWVCEQAAADGSSSPCREQFKKHGEAALAVALSYQ